MKYLYKPCPRPQYQCGGQLLQNVKLSVKGNVHYECSDCDFNMNEEQLNRFLKETK